MQGGDNVSVSKETRERIDKRIISAIGEKPGKFPAAAFAEQEKLTAQSVYRRLKALEDSGKIIKSRSGSSNIYGLREYTEQFTLPLEGLSEDSVWKKRVKPFFSELPDVAMSNLAYAFTEMLNNAIDHSDGTEVSITLTKDGYMAKAVICDNGVGIFNKISAAMDLEEKRYAVLELAKGKFTTSPRSHTGEGIFFSSKVIDRFAIISEELAFSGSGHEPFLDTALSSGVGTTVLLGIKYEHSVPSSEVFDSFTEAPEDYGFSKTKVPVRLLEYGDEKPLVVSRSQAKRLMTRFERFQNIILDFEGIDEIGQGFADELFRVFANEHPGTKLTPVNCNDRVQRMIARVCAGTTNSK